MKNFLKSFYLQEDAEMQTLTKNANSNFLLKLLYLRRKRTTFSDLYKDYKKEIGADSIGEDEVKAILDEMFEKKLIHIQDGLYYLSTNRIDKIDRTIAASIDRKKCIVSTYFCKVYSSPEQIFDWLDDILIFFFDNYSTEWISDLYYNKDYIRHSKEGLLKAVNLRTQNNKNIDKRDREILPDMFLQMLLTPNDPEINSLLWEYGTTAFSAKLITSSHGANPVTLETFRNSICLLDTNVLMNIGLEEGDYFKTLSSLEKVYQHLGIEVEILPTTRDEYLYTIQNIKNDVIQLVLKGYSDDVLMKTGDRYIRTAIQRKCETEEDYERFFSSFFTLPEFFHEELAIGIEDDQSVLDFVEKCQVDEERLKLLGALHESIHNDKKKAAHSLVHDVGLIAGAEMMRTTQKAFILSQDSTISAYSKQKPLEQGLTLSIQMETLINVLALDSGGVEVNPQNYIPLFAQMIRHGLVPDDKTFQVQDLARMSDMEEEVTRLPDEDIVRLATDIATMRMQGESEEMIGLTFRRELQDVKRGIVDQLEDSKRDVEIERNEKERYKTRSNIGEKGLEKEVRNRITIQYDLMLFIKVQLFIVGIILVPVVLYAMFFISNKQVFDDTWKNILLSVGAELVAGVLTCLIVKPGKLIKDFINRKKAIDEKARKEFLKYYEKT